MKLLLPVSLLLLFLFSEKAYAQEFHISIAPTVLQIDATPPSTVETPFQIKNLSNESIVIKPVFIPIEAKDDGKINLLLDEEETLSTFVKNKLSIIDEAGSVENIELRGGETRQLMLFMDLVKGDPPGDYYYSLVFMSEGKFLDRTSTSVIPAGISMNVLISIGPKGLPSLDIEEFSTDKLITGGPVFFNLKVKNTGNHLIQPEGNIVISNIFGKRIADIEILPQYILSESQRYLVDDTQASSSAELSGIIAQKQTTSPVIVWDEGFLMGPYTAELTLSAEKGSNKITEKITFIALPIKVLIIISGLMFVVLGIFLRVHIKLKKTI